MARQRRQYVYQTPEVRDPSGTSSSTLGGVLMAYSLADAKGQVRRRLRTRRLPPGTVVKLDPWAPWRGRRAPGRRDPMPPLKRWTYDRRTGILSWKSSSGAHYVLTPDPSRRNWTVEVAYTVPLLRLLGIHKGGTVHYLTTTHTPSSATEAAKRHYAGVESRYTAARARGWRVPMSMPADWIGWR